MRAFKSSFVKKLSPVKARLEASSPELVYKLGPNSLNVLRIPR